ncbi:MAG: cation diffusion facilitator family transporter [Alphaproteobacteria bacterium]|nr:cation diffusion facilitator family transporter [Alphaproteobacteria bacterium]
MTPTSGNNSLQQIHAEAAGEKSHMMKRASLLTLSGVSFLIIIKLVAWIMTGSLSLLSSLVDSAMDLLASLSNYFAIRYALVPPDNEHRFGHGKVEYIAGMGQALFISITALIVAAEAVHRFFAPVPVHESEVGIVVMLISIVVTLGMVFYQKKAIAHTDSTAVKADYVHYVMDVLANGAVIIALLLVSGFGWIWADPLFALAIAVYILKGAWQVGVTSFQNLMDHEFDTCERERIAEVVLAHPQVKGLHELKTRRSGLLAFIQLHIDVSGDLKLIQAHAITEQVEANIRQLHPNAEVLIHTDPV